MSNSRRLMLTRHRVRSIVNDELAALAHPSAFSGRVAVVFASVSGFAQMVYDARYAGTSITAWAAPTIVSVVIFLVVFAALGRLAHRHQWSPVPVIACFVVAGSARTLSVGAVAMALDVVDTMDWAFRVTGGVLLSPALLVVIATGVGRHDRHLAIVRELQEQRDHLLAIGRSLDDALARTEDEITMAVRAAIAPAIAELDTVLDRVVTDASVESAVTALTNLIDDDVRPISHRLATQDQYLPTSSIDPSHHPRRVRVPVPPRVALATGFRPVLMAMMFVSVAAPTVIRHRTLDAAITQLLTAAVVTLLVLGVLRAVFHPVRTPAVAAIVIVSGLHALAAFTTLPALAGAALTLTSDERLVGTLLAGVIGVVVMTAVVVDDRRTATENELARVVAELNDAVGVMSRRARLASTRLAHVLHGNLQGALHAAAIRLNEANRPDAALVQTIRHDIAVALEHIDDCTWGSADLQHTLDEIDALWAGHRTVTVNLAPEVTSALAVDRDTDAATAEVVREAVNNALRHGRAHSITIDVRLVGDHDASSHRQQVHVTVTDDGSGWPSDATGGLGHILFDDLCTSWSHIDTGAGTQLIATVGLAPPPGDDRPN